ncbi:phage/plasmid replication protein [Pseudomonas sp. PCH446]
MEQELKQEYLIKHGLHFWGLFDESKFIHCTINSCLRLKIAGNRYGSFYNRRKALDDGIVTNMLSANSTAAYVYNWMAGHSFDFKKSQVKIARARLRRIGIDIANLPTLPVTRLCLFVAWRRLLPLMFMMFLLGIASLLT